MFAGEATFSAPPEEISYQMEYTSTVIQWIYNTRHQQERLLRLSTDILPDGT